MKREEIEMKTPCEERGWKMGDKFMVIEIIENIAEKGDVLELLDDEGDNIPFFRDRSGDELHFHIDEVEKIEERKIY